MRMIPLFRQRRGQVVVAAALMLALGAACSGSNDNNVGGGNAGSSGGGESGSAGGGQSGSPGGSAGTQADAGADVMIPERMYTGTPQTQPLLGPNDLNYL